jgi:hypothetical protein
MNYFFYFAEITYATYDYLAYLVEKCLTYFCLCDPALGDSDEEDVPLRLDNALGEHGDAARSYSVGTWFESLTRISEKKEFYFLAK